MAVYLSWTRRRRLCSAACDIGNVRASRPCTPPRLLRCGGGTLGSADGQEAEAERGADTLDALPDGCLFEVLRHVQGACAWGASSCISHRWLALLGGIRAFKIKRA
ncbi:EIN3-binding F-box protein [Hordeum vulgare]|nr:EIN3-binding F-box protein [Hordeum vulgare]